MRILAFILEMVILFLFEVLLPGLRGEFDIDDEGKDRKETVAYIPEETLELADCKTCGKPNPVEHVFCKHCGALLESGRGIFGFDGQAKRRLLVLDIPVGTRELVDCTKCGRSNQAEHVFCKACGELL